MCEPSPKRTSRSIAASSGLLATRYSGVTSSNHKIGSSSSFASSVSISTPINLAEKRSLFCGSFASYPSLRTTRYGGRTDTSLFRYSEKKLVGERHGTLCGRASEGKTSSRLPSGRSWCEFNLCQTQVEFALGHVLWQKRAKLLDE